MSKNNNFKINLGPNQRTVLLTEDQLNGTISDLKKSLEQFIFDEQTIKKLINKIDQNSDFGILIEQIYSVEELNKIVKFLKPLKSNHLELWESFIKK